jgi:hypothetical protein
MQEIGALYPLGPCSHNAAFTNPDAGQDRGAGADPNIVLNGRVINDVIGARRMLQRPPGAMAIAHDLRVVNPLRDETKTSRSVSA